MRQLRNTLVPAALVLCSGLLVAGRPFAEPDPGLRYVDMARCFDNYEAARQEMLRLRDELAEKKKDFDAREAALREIDGELSVMDPSSSEFAQRVHELESSKMALDRDRKFALDRVQMRRLELLVESYRAVSEAAAEVGAQRGYGGIVIIPAPVAELPSDPKERAEAIQLRVEDLESRQVLWTNPAYDVTDEVLAALNG